MKLFSKKEEKNKVGRPKLADMDLKKKSIIMCAISLVLVITLLVTGAFKLNIVNFKNMKGLTVTIPKDNISNDNGFVIDYKYTYFETDDEEGPKLNFYNGSEYDAEILGYLITCDEETNASKETEKEFVISCENPEEAYFDEPIKVKKNETFSLEVEDSFLVLIYKINNKKYYDIIIVGAISSEDKETNIYKASPSGHVEIKSLSKAIGNNDLSESQNKWDYNLAIKGNNSFSLLGTNNLLSTNARSFIISMDISESIEDIYGHNMGKFSLIGYIGDTDNNSTVRLYHPQSNTALSYNNNITNYLDFVPNDEVLESLPNTKSKTTQFYLSGKPKGIYNNQIVPLSFYGEVIDENNNIYTNLNGMDVSGHDDDGMLSPYLLLTTYDKSVLKQKLDYHSQRLASLRSTDMSYYNYDKYSTVVATAYDMYNNRYYYCKSDDYDNSICKNKIKITQTEINEIIKKLDQAGSKVYEKADYSKVEQLLSTINNLDKESYTEESWNNLKEQIDNINSNLNYTKSYQGKVNYMLLDLEKSYNNLKKINKQTKNNNSNANNTTKKIVKTTKVTETTSNQVEEEQKNEISANKKTITKKQTTLNTIKRECKMKFIHWFSIIFIIIVLLGIIILSKKRK